MRTWQWATMAILLQGCQGHPRADSAITTVDSAGIQIVTNAAGDRPVDWKVERLFLIGGDDSGPASFTRAYPATIAAGDGLFHLVNDEKQIVTFDSLGRHVRTVGRSGSGPGELQFPAAVVAGPGGAVGVFDYGKEGVVRFGTKGEPLPLLSVRTLGTPLGPIAVRGDSILMAVQTVDSAGKGLVHLKLARPSDTVLLTTLVSGGKAGMVDLGCVKLGGQPPLFGPQLGFAWNGREIAVTQRADYEVAIYADAKLVRLIRRKVAPTPTTVDLVNRLYPDGFKLSFGGGGACQVSAADFAAKMGMAPFVPAVDEVRFGPQGMLWVRRYAIRNEPARYDLFSADGLYRGTFAAEGQVAGFPTETTVVMTIADSTTDATKVGGFLIVDH